MVSEITNSADIKAACAAVCMPRSSFYRNGKQERRSGVIAKRVSPLALSAGENQEVLDTLHSERFIDSSPSEVYATLLDEGKYLCSPRTMYRILGRHNEVRERRQQMKRTHYSKPELLATKPNQLWSWDITKLKGPVTWTYFYLYVILDVFSRYVVGWMVAERELAVLALKLIADTCGKQGIVSGQLTIHADRGSSMKSKPVALLLSDLGVIKSHSRPSVSNDNPYSEAQFKTLKYFPQFPERFGTIEDARFFCRMFFDWYNNKHHHSGIALLTPFHVHYGSADDVLQKRNIVLQQAYEKNQVRFKSKKPKPMALPPAVWINKPLELCDQNFSNLF